ncbi:hypothetical protein LCGC14_0236380 [marine sediment metagenome]|uniref:Uncharacterized protein n=1 Tax=marine sediment metagenome TaxID=412755 RepID=A0A0F9U9C3_9ZZZZ
MYEFLIWMLQLMCVVFCFGFLVLAMSGVLAGFIVLVDWVNIRLHLGRLERKRK